MAVENYRTPPGVVQKLFLGAAETEFQNRDRGASNLIHIARPDYQIVVTQEFPAAVRPPGENVTLADTGVYSGGEWVFLSLAAFQVYIPEEKF